MASANSEHPSDASNETLVEATDASTTWLRLCAGTFAILVGTVLISVLLAAIAFGLTVAVLGYSEAVALLGQLSSTSDRDQSLTDRMHFGLGLAAYASLCVAVVIMARVSVGRAWRARIAWRAWNPFLKPTMFLVLFGLTLIYSLGADQVVTYLHPEAQSWIPTPHGILSKVLFVMLATVLAPLGEELLFRGWLYTGLKKLSGVPFAIALSAALFALAHWEKTHLYALAIFPIGLVLGYVREKTDSTKASISFHALYNGFAAALLLSK